MNAGEIICEGVDRMKFGLGYDLVAGFHKHCVEHSFFIKAENLVTG
jgi:hypothetical protein